MKTRAEPLPPDTEPTRRIKDDAARWVARRDAGLTPIEQAGYQAWLDADPKHVDATERCAAAWTVLDRPADCGTVDDVLEDLAALDRRQRRRRVASAAAACVALLSLVSVWRVNNTPPSGSSPASLAPPTNAVVLLPARQTLPDHSVVDLRNGAEIAPEFTSTFRKVALRQGEAHFQVTKDTQRPFVVEANGVRIRAVGTAFSVQSDPAQVEVLVTEGRVAVTLETSGSPEDSTDQSKGASTFVDAGHSLVVPAAASAMPFQTTAVPASVVNQRLSWRAPRLEFTGTPLSEAIALINKHADPANGVRFSIEDPSIAQEQISGLFRVDKAEAFIGLLEGGFSIAAERRTDREVVLRRAR